MSHNNVASYILLAPHPQLTFICAHPLPMQVYIGHFRNLIWSNLKWSQRYEFIQPTYRDFFHDASYTFSFVVLDVRSMVLCILNTTWFLPQCHVLYIYFPWLWVTFQCWSTLWTTSEWAFSALFSCWQSNDCCIFVHRTVLKKHVSTL